MSSKFFIGRDCELRHGGLRYISSRQCVSCRKIKDSKRDKAMIAARRQRPELREKARLVATQWRIRNAMRHRANVATWKRENAAIHNAHCMQRMSAKIKRTPAWANHEWITHAYVVAEEMSAKMGESYQVDHELPLQGKVVSGLHVYENLQVIPAIDNFRKGNCLVSQ